MTSSIADIAACLQAVASCLTLVAAALAVWATFKAPERAARLAERLRIDSERSGSIRQERYRIFTTLMHYRGRDISEKEPVDALNMIHVAFFDAPLIRAKYIDFVFHANGNHSDRMRIYFDILVEIARNLGFDITKEDLDRSYWPIEK